MNETLEERKKKAAEQAEDEWKKEQEDKRKKEEKERKLAEIKNTKPGLPKPKKTGWPVLNELFDAVAGEEKSSSVQWVIRSSDYFGIFRVTKNGIAASFTGIPIPKELKIEPLLPESIRGELVDFVTKHPQKDEEDDFIALYGAKYTAGGCLSQTWILKRKFALPADQIPVFEIRNDEFDKIFSPGRFMGFPRGVIDSRSLVYSIIAADKQFTHELATSNFYAKPVYSLTTSLLQLNFPISGNVFNRSRDRSMVLKKPFEYKTRELALGIGDFAKQAQTAEKLEEAIKQQWQTLKELFDYWDVLGEELEKLNSLYHKAGKE